MLVACWSVKGGCGTSVVAAMLALALGRWSAAAVAPSDGVAPLLVDLTGDLPSVLGLPPAATPGVHEWLHAAAGNVGTDALGRLVQPVDGLRLLPRGERRPPSDGGERLVDAVHAVAGSAVAVADCGRAAAPADGLVDSAAVSLLVLRPCYLALGRAIDAATRASAVALIDEPGRALGPAEIEDALGVPVVVSIRARPSIARAVDSGLLSWRPPRRIVRALAGAVEV